jgi:hypothetical protein
MVDVVIPQAGIHGNAGLVGSRGRGKAGFVGRRGRRNTGHGECRHPAAGRDPWPRMSEFSPLCRSQRSRGGPGARQCNPADSAIAGVSLTAPTSVDQCRTRFRLHLHGGLRCSAPRPWFPACGGMTTSNEPGFPHTNFHHARRFPRPGLSTSPAFPPNDLRRPLLS